MDFSLDGLIECRQLLGNRAICICGNLLSLPIKNAVCDGIITSHCLYHIDKDLQRNALSELSRVLSSGRILIFYSNPNSVEQQTVKRLKKIIGKKESTAGERTFYYYAHPLNYMLNMLSSEFGNSKITVKPLRMFTKRISARAFRNKFFGQLFFKVFIFIENLFKERANMASYVAYIVKK